MSLVASPRRFATICHVGLVVWLFVIYVPLNWMWDHSKSVSRPLEICLPMRDFPQYYIAGVAARYGLWDHLYPKIKPEWSHRPGRRIWDSNTSQADPELLARIQDLPESYNENIAPPPQALLCLPLAYFSLSVAFKLWMTGLILATYATVICAIKVYRQLGGPSDWIEGFFLLFGMLIPVLTRIGAADNAMMFLVLCVGLAALSWLKERPFTLATSLIIPLVFKGLTMTWCPLLLVPPIKWRTLVWMTAWTIMLNGSILLIAGFRPFDTWIHDVLPNALDMEAQAYWHHNMNFKGIAYNWGWKSFPASSAHVFMLGGIIAVYCGFWAQRKAQGTTALANLCAAIAAALVIFNLTNSVSWMMYVTMLFPFAGWALIEFDQASPSTRKSLLACVGILMLFVPLLHLALSRLTRKIPEDASDIVRDFYVGVEIYFLILAYRRLFWAKPLT